MFYLYDKAVENKIKSIFNNTVYSPVNQFLTRYNKAISENTSVSLPALSIWRTTFDPNIYTNRTTLTVPNYTVRNKTNLTAKNIYSIDMNLRYQLDIWANRDIDRDNLLCELLYYFSLKPNITFDYYEDYNIETGAPQGKFIQSFSFAMILEKPDIPDEIDNFDNTGDLFRATLNFHIDSARMLFNKDIKLAKYLTYDVEVKDPTTNVSEKI